MGDAAFRLARHRQQHRQLLHRSGASRRCERWFINLPDDDLAYLPEGSSLFDDYVEAVGWAQDYARVNRERDDGGGAATCCAAAFPDAGDARRWR